MPAPGALSAGAVPKNASNVQTRPAATPVEQEKMVHLLRNVLFTTLILVGIFAVSSYAFIRLSKRYRRWILQKTAEPTPHQDVWQMYKVPKELLPEDEAENG